MSGTVGYENVKATVAFVGVAASGLIRIGKKAPAIIKALPQIAIEIKDTQVDEVMDLMMVDVRQAFGEVLKAIQE
jgi:hypothetical protein